MQTTFKKIISITVILLLTITTKSIYADTNVLKIDTSKITPIYKLKQKSMSTFTTIGYKKTKDKTYISFNFKRKITGDEIGALYLDADCNENTGRKNMGNDYFIHPGKKRIMPYSKSHKELKRSSIEVYKEGNSIILGISNSKLKGGPINNNFCITLLKTKFKKYAQKHFDAVN